MQKIALEEHFITEPLLPYLLPAMPAVSDAGRKHLLGSLTDFGEQRLKAMDAAGVDIAVLSVTGPGVQTEPDAKKATALAAGANDALAGEIQKRPTRYRGFAHLAMQDADAAADELERCVKQLGFAGALVNGHTNGVYLDDPCYDPFWERLQALDVPLYLHPADSFKMPYVLQGCPEMDKPVWEWTIETSAHFLRLVFAGVFDRFPKLKIVLGHMGETLPYVLWRLDSRFALLANPRPLKEKPSTYLTRNLWVTTAGQCDDVPLLAALSSLGEDRVLFSVDYPYEDSATAGRFLDRAAIDDAVRAKVARENAAALMKLSGV